MNDVGKHKHAQHDDCHQGDDPADVGSRNGIEGLCGTLRKIRILCDRIRVQLLAAPSHTDDARKQQVEAPGPDDRVRPQMTDHEAVDHTDHQSGRNADQKCHREAQVDALHRQHAGHCHRQRDRHISPVAGIGDIKQTGCNHSVQCHRLQNRLDVTLVKEVSAVRRRDNGSQDQQ